MTNPISSLIKKGEQFFKHLGENKEDDGINDAALKAEINEKKWVNMAVEKVNKGELWRKWFK